ncbi:glycosyltransferase [Methylobacterium sp.]|uniref:glycosyltransferase n=1 Tax=Methylobacterium sp. TaxID=409 RepID=UPI002588B4CD|nr:glycosyltransferase [Methylobacterium sp.]
MPEPEIRPPGEEAVPSSILRSVIAVPVRNEAERIGSCLLAFAGQEGLGAGELGVILLLNNCTDDTDRVVAALAPDLPFRLRVLQRTFAGATAGWARREAMQAAADWLEQEGATDGIILTTDADCRASADWVARTLAVLAEGVDAVAGRIVLDPDEAARLPASLHARGRLEGAYEALLVALEACIDPLAHDPWPRHWTTSGATLAVRLATYRQVGGMPPLAVGEDRAFVSSLLSSDVRVRHDPDLVMITSGRLDGRAPGGAADTMRLRCEVPESPCDPRLEPLPLALFRFLWRARLRRLHAVRRLGRTHLWAPWLGIRTAEARSVAALASAGAALAAIEQASPRLAFRPLRPAELPSQIRYAGLALAVMRAAARCSRSMRRLSGPRNAAGEVGPPVVERPGHA